MVQLLHLASSITVCRTERSESYPLSEETWFLQIVDWRAERAVLLLLLLIAGWHSCIAQLYIHFKAISKVLQYVVKKTPCGVCSQY